MNEESFPSLISNDNIETAESAMNFISATKKEKIKDNNSLIMDKILPGWVRISMNNNRKIVYEYGENTNIDYDAEYEDYVVKKEINAMINRWEKYKENYLDLYGEEEYEKNFMSYDAYNTENDSEEYD